MIENIEPKYFTDEFEDGITETRDILGNSDVVLSDLLNDERLIPLYTEKQMKDYAKANNPYLAIPSCIADELDLINASEYENLIENFFESYNDSTLSERLYEFCRYPFNFNLCILYLVSIELGVSLVKVV